MPVRFDLSKIKGFEWDQGNLDHIKKHKVDYKECEEIFSNKPLVLFNDEKHSNKEQRFGVLGKTSEGRKLAIFFTVRSNKIRIISARDQGKKDRLNYQTAEREVKYYE